MDRRAGGTTLENNFSFVGLVILFKHIAIVHGREMTPLSPRVVTNSSGFYIFPFSILTSLTMLPTRSGRFFIAECTTKPYLRSRH
jgi:hypothetical protein